MLRKHGMVDERKNEKTAKSAWYVLGCYRNDFSGKNRTKYILAKVLLIKWIFFNADCSIVFQIFRKLRKSLGKY